MTFAVNALRILRWRRRVRLLVGVSLALLCALLLAACGPSEVAESEGGQDIVASTRADLIPAEWTATDYGVPLSLDNLSQFLDWSDSIQLSSAENRTYESALKGVPTPCCDDHMLFSCCCENDGLSCNLVRSGKGLAAHLVHNRGYGVQEVKDALLEWMRFARPDYYIAKELTNKRLDPEAYGLTPYGSCYRGMCNTSIAKGGCGGMERI